MGDLQEVSISKPYGTSLRSVELVAIAITHLIKLVILDYYHSRYGYQRPEGAYMNGY